MKKLLATHSLPYCTPAGKIIARVGYEHQTQLYVHLPIDYTPNLPEQPSADEVRAAVVRLVAPFRAYSLATPDDAAAVVCAVLTVVARPTLELCPAILVDASTQGSGKTKLAVALASLASGRREGVLPFSGIDDDELRKQLIASVIGGQRALCLDNVVGHFKSPVMASVLTSGRLQGRVLGQSREVDAAVRSLFTMTANNASLDADLTRRTMRVRIDSGSAPTLRRFDFDPITEAVRDRLAIAEAACTLWRAYFNAGAPRIANDDAGGFTDWSSLCRQPVLWLAREGLADGLGWQLGDPAAHMLADPSGSDPEVEVLGDMLRALNALASDGMVFGSQDVVAWWRAGEHDEVDGPFRLLRDAITEALNLRAGQEPGSRSVGRMLAFRRDRVVGGLRLLSRDDRAANSKLFRVVSCA